MIAFGMETHKGDNGIAIHLTNVQGIGATAIVRSLVPEIEALAPVTQLFTPCAGELASYVSTSGAPAIPYVRRLPNALSRVLECLLGAPRLPKDVTLLVLGDIPLRTRNRQVVLVHTTHAVRDTPGTDLVSRLKFAVMRKIVRLNSGHVDLFIVQSDDMRDSLERLLRGARERIHVIPPPPPSWLLEADLHRQGRKKKGDLGAPLQLFYPASPYPHKNHALLRSLAENQAFSWPVEKLFMTISTGEFGLAHKGYECIGRLDTNGVLRHYGFVDGLLFPSLTETVGLPLLEAMHVGLPVVCADLPYARRLCRETAIYFDPHDPSSLVSATRELHDRLSSGWWPDWSTQMASLPSGWAEVAGRILDAI
jgi:glycosyltransferase involved in cell wall biosynthesis